jgi:hypothetical protein
MKALLLLLVGCLLLALPAMVLAAAPANDDFANRQVVSGALPIEVTGSNVEATKEAGELIPGGPSPAGHSIWFEWEAQSTGYVTIGACVNQFPTILAIFTGTEIDNLTQVVSGEQNEGPDCPFTRRQFTFKAQGGTTYVIAVDGNDFFEDGPPPVTEGEVVLQIEATPPPPNDAFAAATPITGAITKSGGQRFFNGMASGYNWLATVEPEEPTHGAGAGASVWYSWTTPASGQYVFGPPCCGAGSGLPMTVYVGTALGALTPMHSGDGPGAMELGADTPVRIAVFGEPDAGTGEPTMAHFEFSISGTLAPEATETPNPLEPTPPLPDTAPPQTKIERTSLLGASRTVRFWLSASEPTVGYLCQLDKGPYKGCGTPRTYRKLGPGRHTFRVNARDLAGNLDPSPAVAHFALRLKHDRHRR